MYLHYDEKNTVQNDDLFDNVTKQYGGLFRSDEWFVKTTKFRHDNFLSAYTSLGGLVRPLPKIIYNFVDNDQINAFATKYNDIYVIAIYKGLLFKMMEVTARMVANENIFSNLKDSEQRKHYAWHLCWLGMDFIFEHELSHIVNGHVDYLHDSHSVSVFHEFIMLNQAEKLVNHELQVFEMDADCTALSRLCIWAKNQTDAGVMKQTPIFGQFCPDLIMVWGDIFIAMSIVFRLFGDNRVTDTTTFSSSHPNPRIRQLILANTYRTINSEYDIGFKTEDLWSYINNRFHETEQAFEIVTGEKTNPDIFKAKYSTDHPALTQLQNTWETSIRTTLMPYTYFPLAE